MRKRRSYKFTNKHHSQGGIRSSIAGAVSLICTVLSIYSAYKAKGNAGNYLALLGFIAVVSCIYGMITGKRSYREEECYYFFSGLGTIGNFILVAIWISLIGTGLVM